eukprot:scaffold218447_cov37-Prasinocladus_malaysianus.AAC.1
MLLYIFIHTAVRKMAARFTQELKQEQAARQDATSAVVKLQGVITSVKSEMEAATLSAEIARSELAEEQIAREEAEEKADALRQQLEEVQAEADAKNAEMQRAMQSFRAEMAAMQDRSQQAWGKVQEKQASVDK